MLKLCQKNILQNCPHLDEAQVVPNVSVMRLNWNDPAMHLSEVDKGNQDHEFSWKQEDVQLLKKTSFIIAADGI